jgi:acyl carrier protein
MSSADFVSLLQREEVTIVNLPASFWLEWLTGMNDKGVEMPSTLRRVIVGNEKTLEETLAKWQRTVGQQVEWCNAYGPSETTITVSNYEPATTSSAREEKSVVPIGRPSLNVELYVLDPSQHLVPTGVAGELYIGGAGLARGYHNQPAQTAERFIPHPYSQSGGERLYRTGDLARYRADGNIEFLGRVDEQVKIRGFRIEVGEVEAVLAHHTGVRESVVVAREDDRGNTRLVAYVVANNNADLPTAELRNYMKQRLADYMLPSAIVRLEVLPLTPNGKVDRKALPAPDGAAVETDGPFVAPRSELERLIAEVWRETLGVERVGVGDNFFNLGGHSLLLIRVNNRLRDTLRMELPVVELFKYPTVSALAEHLSGSRTQPGAAARVGRSETALLSRQRELRRRQATRSSRAADTENN